MRATFVVSTFALALGSCGPLPQSVGPSNEPVQMQQVTWKESTPFFARLADGRDCGAIALGVSIVASPEEISAASAKVSGIEVAQRRDACMAQRGYSIAGKPICRPGQSDGKQIYISSLTDALPPLSSVECLVPGDSRPGSAGFILVG